MLKKRIILGALILAAFILGAIATDRYGASLRKDREVAHLAVAQGTLAFNHYKDFQEIEQFIEQKCYEQALADAKFNKDSELMRLADYLRDAKSPGLEKYVNDRDPGLLKSPLPTRPKGTDNAVVLAPCSSSRSNTK
jgi:hypothetical protein